MTTLRKNDLEFDFRSAIDAFIFDDDRLHGKSTMKRVDFIVEYNDRYFFIEIKDPDKPSASNPDAFRKKLLSGNLIPDLASKFRDSLWFRTLSNKANKPVYYLVLLSMACLEPALLLNKQDELLQSLPMVHKEWTKPFAKACIILNLEQYKKEFGADSVRRLSSGP